MLVEGEEVFSTSLFSKTAIEYHTANTVIKISQKEVDNVAMNVKRLINNIDGISNFIAINHDVKQFCVPALIQGISDAGRAFVYRPKKFSLDICVQLKVTVIFSQTPIVGAETLYELDVHGQPVRMLMYKHLNIAEPQRIHSSNSGDRKFLFAVTTSGSTGIPRTVRVTFQSIAVNVRELAKIFELGHEDKVAHLTPMTFDPSYVELFLGLWYKCTLFMVSEEVKSNPRLIMDKMIESEVTFFQTTPSLLLGRWSKESLRTKLLSPTSNLKVLALGGEPFPKIETIDEIKNKNNNTRLFNLYGITEVSCWASVNEIVPGSLKPLETNTTYLGKPLKKTIFFIKETSKDQGNAQGDLMIGSDERLCEVDDEDFVLDGAFAKPFFRDSGDVVRVDLTGNIFYIGRRDCIIKRFGTKVNLTEIENLVLTLPSIQKSVAIWNENEHKLHLCLVSISPSTKFPGLYSLLDTFPETFRPDKIHFMADFPLTEHGKICKSSLLDICERRARPMENVREILRDLWREHLNSDENFGFLAAGGNSVLALQLSNAVSSLYKTKPEEILTLLLQNSNFEEFLDFVSKGTQEKQVDVPVKSEESQGSFPIKRQRFSWQKCRGQTHKPLFYPKAGSLKILETVDLGKCIDGSPTIFKCESQIYVTVGSHSGMICTVSLDGSEKYYVTLKDRVEASICVLDNFRAVVGCHDHNIYCLNLKTGDIFWKFKTGDSVRSSALACARNNAVFIGSHDHLFHSINHQTGKENWQTHVSDGTILAEPRYNPERDQLFVGTLDGYCAALERETGRMVWRRKLPNAIFSSPAILQNGDVIYGIVDGTLFCFNPLKDVEVWRFSTKLSIFSYLVVHKDPRTNLESICFMAKDTFFRIECDEKFKLPVQKYKVKLGSHSSCTPWCEGNLVVVADSQGVVYVLDFEKGWIIARIQLGGEIYSSPALHEDRIVVGCRNNKLYLLQLLQD